MKSEVNWIDIFLANNLKKPYNLEYYWNISCGL